MTREQAKQKLISFGIAEPTEEAVTSYLNSIADEKKPLEAENTTLKEGSTKLEELQRKVKEYETQGMTESQKAIEDANAAKEAAEKLASDFQMRLSKLSVEKVFVGAGLTEEDYSEFIDGIVGTDSEKSTKLAESFAKTISKQKESAIAQLKKEQLENTGTPGGSGSGETGEKQTLAEKLAVGSLKTSTADEQVAKYYS